ncbi:putative bifunctional diguanylate cyclase/phosphodiesterase [Shimia sagamensis]|uniref:Diguanylate cyclase (GGDEF) domain-containing protein n=1 Tax=Shimia sagamensis TaxID=1566352 RepID=A0ABY1NJC3_9RHOB|nr:EAL domain-containing protein [Shimia sagamensis]SMP10870.1 diguanylate cyclase (GGDEF) domain-containing protein [Shimia sagamensis]
MRAFSRIKAKLRWHHMVHGGIFLFALVLFPILGEYELFEEFYEYSREHEDWELDELALLVVLLTVALLFSVVFQGRHLRSMSQEREAMRKSAEANARHDPLTGVMNRRAFKEVAEGLVKEAKTAETVRYIALLDLDKFKPVNDLHGHAVGDATLIEVAERLKTEAGVGGTVARLGGDEFAILLDPLVNAAQAERAAQRLVHAIARPFHFGEIGVFIGTSVGLVALRQGDDISEVMRRADKAMYVAKTQGRGRFAWYDAEQDRQSMDREKLAADLREAIAHDQVEPWFQPIVEIDDNLVSGVEVLARWNHPERGFIPPGVFIEIAEDSGQIGALGLSVLRQACSQANEWAQPLTVSFNVSGVQFKDLNLVPSIRMVLESTGFDPKRLIVEITESSVIDDFDVAREKLDELKTLGVSIALDDFGTGYSSLACLQNLPFDRLKIDRSFVTDISDHPQSQKIVSGIVSLAQGLHLEVTAEGIETVEDLAYVSYLDCQRAQGFLFEKAVPAAQVEELLETKWDDLPTVPLSLPKAVGKSAG